MSRYVKSLRSSRKWHRTTGLVLALLLFISAVTGVLLALKKEVDVLQPPTQRGTSKSLADWLPVADLGQRASIALVAAHPDQADNVVDRLDIRPSKGIVKVLFENGNWEVQVDGSTGEVKSIAKRHSDWIESLHDGSIISDGFKLLSMNVLGWGVLLLMFSGLWLWYGPKRVRAERKKSN